MNVLSLITLPISTNYTTIYRGQCGNSTWPLVTRTKSNERNRTNEIKRTKEIEKTKSNKQNQTNKIKRTKESEQTKSNERRKSTKIERRTKMVTCPLKFNIWWGWGQPIEWTDLLQEGFLSRLRDVCEHLILHLNKCQRPETDKIAGIKYIYRHCVRRVCYNFVSLILSVIKKTFFSVLSRLSRFRWLL